MFRPYRTLKIKVPRPCCPWCQAHSERIEQKLQAMEEEIQELTGRLATLLTTPREAENVSAGFLTALQLFGLNSSLQRTGEESQSASVHPVGAFSGIITALDRLAETSAGPAPTNLVPPSPNTLSPHQLRQIPAPRKGSRHPAA